MSKTPFPAPVPGIHILEAKSLKGQSSIGLTGFDPLRKFVAIDENDW